MKKRQPTPTTQTIWTVSNGLSFLRLLLTAPVVLLLAHPYGNRWSILALCLLAYVTDLGDGYLARRFKQETKAGRIIDPLADKIFVGGAMLAMLASGHVPLWYVASVLGRDAIILLAGAVVSVRSRDVLPSNMTGKAAVLSIGVVMLAVLFEDMLASATIMLLMLASMILLLASLIKYGERVFVSTHKNGK